MSSHNLLQELTLTAEEAPGIAVPAKTKKGRGVSQKFVSLKEIRDPIVPLRDTMGVEGAVQPGVFSNWF